MTGCMADYDEDCKGKKPKGCMCPSCCQPRLRAYMVNYDDGEGSELVIAETLQEAKVIAWNQSDWLSDVGEYIEIRAKWCRGNTEGLTKGLHEDWIDELNKLLVEKRKEQVLLRSKLKGDAKLSGKPSLIRKEIAIIQTIINQKLNKIHFKGKK
jgi:ribosomal protein L29